MFNRKVVPLLLIVALAICMVPSNEAAAPESCHLREFDLCMTSAVVFIQQPQGVKVSEEQIEKQCNLFKETEECIQSYTDNCMTKSQHQLIDFASGGILKTMKDYCRKGSDIRAQYLKHGECVQKQRKATNKCLIDFQAAVEKSTVDSTHWKDRPKVLCCALDRYRACLEAIIEPACGKEALNVANMLAKGTFSRAATITCDKYKHRSSQCQGLLPPTGTVPKGSKSGSVLSKLISTITQA
ncbi:hypothetical protein GZH46_03057 [Fragariocoptes setiger]|uniref:Uncharacterized protein n=1 Tax=Fragariocoptes setiger TaxID=1670756 RepID=A0ABQ7S4V4_9ACAR|nr:hypothetical protein GZH46_03057 [Fragariocoptes setiger]